MILYPRADPALQEEIIASCARHDFWRLVGTPRPPRLPRTFISAPFLCQAPTQIGKNPPGYYLLAALALKLCPSPTLVGQMYWLRSLNAFFSLLTVGAVFLCARRVFGSDFFPALAAAGLIAALPQFAVIGSSVSPIPWPTYWPPSPSFCSCPRPPGTAGSSLPSPAVILLGLAVSYKFLIILGAYLLFRLAVLILPGEKSLRRAAVLTLAAEALALCFVYFVLLWFAPRLVGIFLGDQDAARGGRRLFSGRRRPFAELLALVRGHAFQKLLAVFRLAPLPRSARRLRGLGRTDRPLPVRGGDEAHGRDGGRAGRGFAAGPGPRHPRPVLRGGSRFLLRLLGVPEQLPHHPGEASFPRASRLGDLVRLGTDRSFPRPLEAGRLPRGLPDHAPPRAAAAFLGSVLKVY